MNIEEAKLQKNDVEAIFMLKGEMIMGTINIDAKNGFSYYFSSNLDSISFVPVYNVTGQSLDKKTLLVKKDNLDWMSPNIVSNPERDCVIESEFNPIKVAVKLQHNTFLGELNLGSHTRLSDRLNDTSSDFIALVNVEFRNLVRTIYINSHSILSVLER